MTQQERQKAEQLEKLRKKLKTEVRYAIGIMDAALSGIPAVGCLYQGLWKERDLMMAHLGRMESAVDITIKDVDRDVGNIFGREQIFTPAPGGGGTQ